MSTINASMKLLHRTWSTKSENYVIDNVSSRIRWKKFGELWSTNHKVLEVQSHSLNQLFQKTIFRPIGAPQNFYT